MTPGAGRRRARPGCPEGTLRVAVCAGCPSREHGRRRARGGGYPCALKPLSTLISWFSAWENWR
jgi:hypothetical protein